MPPYGGPASRHEHRDESVRASAGFIKGGEAHLEHVETHAWDDTLVVAMVERQHGGVEGRPDQDVSLRVTHVYRRVGDGCAVEPQHSDPAAQKRGPPQPRVGIRRTVANRVTSGPGQEPTMPDKSPRQHMTKKQGQTIKEKRADKKGKANAAASSDPVSRVAKR